MTLYDYLRILRSRWTVVVRTTLVVILVAAAAAFLSPTRYSASTGVLFELKGEADPGQQTRSVTYAASVVQTYTGLVRLPVVLDPVIARLDLDEDAATLAQNVSASARKNSLILRVSASDRDPVRAAAVANAVAEQLAILVEDISTGQLPGAVAAAPAATGAAAKNPAKFGANPVSKALPPTSPVLPRTLLLGLGAAIGLFAGALLAIVVGVRDRRIMDRHTATVVTDLQVVGEIPARSRRRGSRRRHERSTRGRAQETAATLLALTIRSSTRTLAFTCAYEDEASVVAVASLGEALSRLGHQVLMIDADVQAPQLAQVIDPKGDSTPPVGLTDVLAGRTTWRQAAQPTRPGGPSLLTAGGAEVGADPLVSPKFSQILAEASRDFALVLVKAPPALRAADGLLVSALVDQVILVTDEAAMSQRSLLELAGSLDLVGARPLGLILSA